MDHPACTGPDVAVPEFFFKDLQGGLAAAVGGCYILNALFPEFIRDGLQGIEAYHMEHSAGLERYYLRFAKKNHLAYSGGSDFHNRNHNRSEIGIPAVPYSTVNSLKELFGVSQSET